MDLLKNTERLLEMNPNPAFAVKDGKIACVNSAARQRFIVPGSEIAPMLLTGKAEYESFRGDCLCLRMEIEGSIYDASIQMHDQMQLFVLESPNNSAELRAMALVAQELRLPLSGMTNLTDDLLPAMLQESPQAKEQLAQLNKNLHQLLRIVGNMSDAYYYSNLTNPILETMNLTVFFREHFEKIGTLLETTKIDFQYDLPTKDIFAPINNEILSKAVYNLFSNSVKFTPAGGHIQASVTADKKKLTFQIRNSGFVPEEMHSNPFRRFLRQPGIEDGRYGIGLGMELTRAAANIHNGTILMCRDEEGVTFTMTVSLRVDEPYNVCSPVLHFDSLGGMDLGLSQLSDALPANLYTPK